MSWPCDLVVPAVEVEDTHPHVNHWTRVSHAAAEIRGEGRSRIRSRSLLLGAGASQEQGQEQGQKQEQEGSQDWPRLPPVARRLGCQAGLQGQAQLNCTLWISHVFHCTFLCISCISLPIPVYQLYFTAHSCISALFYCTLMLCISCISLHCTVYILHVNGPGLHLHMQDVTIN